MWIEVLKIIASSGITAIIVGYFFNKRLEQRKMLLNMELEQHKMLLNMELEQQRNILSKTLEERKMILKINEQFISSLMTGLNKLLNDYRALVIKVDEIGKQLENNCLNLQCIKNIESLRQTYLETFRSHRIYLIPLIPWGSSSNLSSSLENPYDHFNLVAISALLEILRMSQEESDQALAMEYREACSRAIDKVRYSYQSVCQQANQIIQYLGEGANPFNISWKSGDPKARSIK
jgi:hypothetical protein